MTSTWGCFSIWGSVQQQNQSTIHMMCIESRSGSRIRSRSKNRGKSGSSSSELRQKIIEAVYQVSKKSL